MFRKSIDWNKNISIIIFNLIIFLLIKLKYIIKKPRTDNVKNPIYLDKNKKNIDAVNDIETNIKFVFFKTK